MKSPISIHKILEVEVPIWENDVMTDVKEPRVLVCFKRTATLNGVKTYNEMGSMFLDRGVTLAQAIEALPVDTDYSDSVDFVNKNEKNFYKAVLK
jgi:hypothetical protein